MFTSDNDQIKAAGKDYVNVIKKTWRLIKATAEMKHDTEQTMKWQ